jgi:rhodanese-related sulfurtransferase
MRTLLLLASLASTAACGDASAGGATSESAAAWRDIGVDELKPLVADKKVILLDANGTESFAEGHIPGAIDFRANAEKLAASLPADKSALIVAYCGGPSCGAWEKAAKAAAALGYTNIRHFSAGISGWKAAGAPTES